MAISFFRVIRKNGDSLGVTIPTGLIKKEGLQTGSRVWVILRKFGAVRVKNYKPKTKRLK